MKRFLAFYSAQHYPEGGMNDFIGDFDEIEDAFSEVEDARRRNRHQDHDWDNSHGHILDTNDRIIYHKLDKSEALVWKAFPLK